MRLRCHVLDRRSLETKSFFTTSEYAINRDYLTNEKSSFLASFSTDVEQGDFLFVKSDRSGANTVYFGVVNSFDGAQIECEDLYSLVNFDFVATRTTGTSFEQHFKNLLDFYLFKAERALGNVAVEAETSTHHSYQPSDPPTITNLVDYLVNAFRKYNIVWEIDGVESVGVDRIRIKSTIRRKAKRIKLKNNAHAFLNWSVYVTPSGRTSENMLQIISSETSNSEAPIILDTWYVDIRGNFTKALTNVRTPVSSKIFIYDMESEEKPTYENVARSELSVNKYAHEIEFDLKRDNHLLTLDDLEIGLLAEINYNGENYESVLTGYEYGSNNEFIKLKFGHIRSTFSDIL